MSQKLSDLIAAGAKLRPPSQGLLMQPDGSTCALGAALTALLPDLAYDAGGAVWEEGWQTLAATLGYDPHIQEAPPALKALAAGSDTTIAECVIYLNDTIGLPRDVIAGKLAGVGL